MASCPREDSPISIIKKNFPKLGNEAKDGDLRDPFTDYVTLFV